MFDTLVWERAYATLPTVYALLGVYIVGNFAIAFMGTIYNDKVVGIISHRHRGEAPMLIIVITALLATWPMSWIPYVSDLWFDWLERRYQTSELVFRDKKFENAMEQAVIKNAIYRIAVERPWQIVWGTNINVLIIAPIGEELLFRLILIVLFPTLNTVAMAVIVLSALAFGAVHWFGQGALLGRKLLRFASDQPMQTPTRERIVPAISATIAGLIFGTVAVATQSILISIMAHVLWNGIVVILMHALWWQYNRKATKATANKGGVNAQT